MRRLRAQFGVRCLLVGSTLVATAGCGSDLPVPSSDWSRSAEAQASLDVLAERWQRSDPAGRAKLRPALAAHIAQHGDDPSSRRARAWLALAALEADDEGVADDMARRLREGPAGASRDIGTVVQGWLARKRGDPKAALTLQKALFNKLLDDTARTINNRELMLTSLATGDLAGTTEYLHALLRQASIQDRPEAERLASEVLPKLPPRRLFVLLQRERAYPSPDRALMALLASEITSGVLRTEDAQLARDLLGLAGDLLDDRADAVARIAARGAVVRLERNTVGMVLSLRSEELRRRSTDAAFGLAAALGIPGTKTRLVTRDDMRDVTRLDETMALLNADGAAVIVAGVDQPEADMAAAYAERTGVSVVLLRAPTKTVRNDGPVFVLGEEPNEARQVLAKTLTNRGFDRIALLLGDRDQSDRAATLPGVVGVQGCGASLDFVHTSAAKALLIDGGPACVSEGLAHGAGLELAVGLDAGTRRGAAWQAAAGSFPFAPNQNEDIPASAREWLSREGSAPTWWQGLGHDAGALVKEAVMSLPPEDDGSARALARQREQVVASVAVAKSELWTTQAQGFAGGRRIQRSLRVLEPTDSVKPTGSKRR